MSKELDINSKSTNRVYNIITIADRKNFEIEDSFFNGCAVAKEL